MSQEKPAKGKVIVFGILFWYPLAGVTYQFLHYLVGLRRLGYEVYYIEDSARWVYNLELDDFSQDPAQNVAAMAPVLEAHGFGGRWAFRAAYPGGQSYGMSEDQIRRLYREADAFLNVTGSQEIREEHLACPRRIYVETDPFSEQIHIAQGDEETITWLSAHDTHFSFGENLGAPDCTVPVGRFQWLPTRQPVVVDWWQDPQAIARPAFTTIATWHNPGKEIVYEGEAYYWTKDREFLKLLDLGRLRPGAFELALGREEKVWSLLGDHGWAVVDSLSVSRTTDAYRHYIQTSRGEFTVAKDQFVRPRTGWFSDRSASYLAAGRPVITQETGFSKFLPTGRGLFGFSNLEEVLAAVDEIGRDYDLHCRAARDIAAEYFGAEKVLASLMERAGL